MKTIQIKLSDEEYNHILELSGQSTGIKALKEIVISYQQDKFAIAEYTQRYKEQQETIRDLNNRITEIIGALHTLNKYTPS